MAKMQTILKQFLQPAIITVISFCMVSASVAGPGKGASPQGQPFQQIRNDIADIQSQINAFTGSFDTVEERLEADEVLLQELVDANAELQDQLDDINTEEIQKQVDDNTQLISALETEINSLYGELAMKQSIVDGFCPDGSAIRQVNEDGTVLCEPVIGTSGGSSGGFVVTNINSLAIAMGDADAGESVSLEAFCNAGFFATAPIFMGAKDFAVEESLQAAKVVSGELVWGWRTTLVNNFNMNRFVITGANCQKVDIQAAP